MIQCSILIYVGTNFSRFNDLTIVQRKFLRLIFSKGFRDRAHQEFEKSKVLSVEICCVSYVLNSYNPSRRHLLVS